MPSLELGASRRRTPLRKPQISQEIRKSKSDDPSGWNSFKLQTGVDVAKFSIHSKTGILFDVGTIQLGVQREQAFQRMNPVENFAVESTW